ncbi:MAG: hypothetical protein WBD78_03705 [Methylocella sp.]
MPGYREFPTVTTKPGRASISPSPTPAACRLPQLYDMRGPQKPLPNTQQSTGAVLNYLLFGGGGRDSSVTDWQFQGVSATLDARLYSPYGILSQSGILASDSGGSGVSPHLRLESTWTYKSLSRNFIMDYRAFLA